MSFFCESIHRTIEDYWPEMRILDMEQFDVKFSQMLHRLINSIINYLIVMLMLTKWRAETTRRNSYPRWKLVYNC